jgi:hypothetical protein
MAANDKGAGPIVGQVVQYQVSGSHAIVAAIIWSLGTNGTANLATIQAGNALTAAANVPFAPALDGASAAFDNRWTYAQFF